MNTLQIGAKVCVKVGRSQGKTGVVYADLRPHRREHPWHVQIDGAGETGRIAYSEDELEVIEEKTVSTGKRYEVTVKEVAGEVEQCGICDRWFEWSGQPRLQSFKCPVCGRECCMHCSSETFPDICDECEELPIEKQVKIAELTADLNQ